MGHHGGLHGIIGLSLDSSLDTFQYIFADPDVKRDENDLLLIAV